MRYQMCVWDLDGTLLHTLPGLRYFNNRTLKHFGFRPVSYEESYELIKYPLGQYYENMLLMGGCPMEEIAKIVPDVTAYDYGLYCEDCTKLIEEFPGVKDTIRELRKMQIISAVHSNKYDRISKQIVKTFFDEEIALVCGQSDDHPSKPKPGCLDPLLKATGILPERVLYIGDTQVDILTAQNSHIDCAAVTWGYQTRDVLESYHPAYLIDSPEEILEIMKENENVF